MGNITSKRRQLPINTLFDKFKSKFPETWREDKWYLTAAASLIGCNRPHDVGHLYSYLISQPEYKTSEQRKHLIRRLREVMMKCIIINGIPVVLAALHSIVALEKEEDKDHSFSRDGWQINKETYDRGLSVLEFLYRDDHERIMSKYNAHRDIRFVSTNVSYGLFLADHTVLDLVESEFVILPAIMCQNLQGPTLWHLRGCLRAGVSIEDTELIHQAIEIIAKDSRKKLDQIKRVGEVSEDMSNALARK